MLNGLLAQQLSLRREPAWKQGDRNGSKRMQRNDKTSGARQEASPIIAKTTCTKLVTLSEEIQTYSKKVISVLSGSMVGKRWAAPGRFMADCHHKNRLTKIGPQQEYGMMIFSYTRS